MLTPMVGDLSPKAVDENEQVFQDVKVDFAIQHALRQFGGPHPSPMGPTCFAKVHQEIQHVQPNGWTHARIETQRLRDLNKGLVDMIAHGSKQVAHIAGLQECACRQKGKEHDKLQQAQERARVDAGMSHQQA